MSSGSKKAERRRQAGSQLPTVPDRSLLDPVNAYWDQLEKDGYGVRRRSIIVLTTLAIVYFLLAAIQSLTNNPDNVYTGSIITTFIFGAWVIFDRRVFSGVLQGLWGLILVLALPTHAYFWSGLSYGTIDIPLFVLGILLACGYIWHRIYLCIGILLCGQSFNLDSYLTNTIKDFRLHVLVYLLFWLVPMIGMTRFIYLYLSGQ